MKKTTLAVSLLCLSMSSVQARITTENENLPAEKQTASQLNQQQLIERMRNTWRNNFVPSGSAANTGLSKEYIAALNRSANNLWKGIDKNAPVAQLWEDTVLDDESTSGRLKLGTTLYTVYQRLFILAKAWATPGTDLYKNTQLYTVLKSALINLNLDYYNDQTPEWGNWWNWELGISRSVNNTLVILYEELPASLINKYNLATRHFVRDPRYLAEGSGAPYSTTKNAFTSTGGNRIDSAMVVFVRGLLANDPTEINAAVVSVPEVLNTVQSGDGFYPDGSFIQHKDLAYSGTYGQVLLNGLGLIKNSVAGTPWDFSSEDNRRIYSVIRDAFLPLLLEGKMPDAVNGRSISRKNGQDRDVGASVMNAIALFVNGAPAEDKRHIERVLKAQLNKSTAEYYHSHLPENLTSWQVITRIQQDKDLPPAPQIPGAKLYADMDRLVYQGANYQAVVAMHSSRTGSYECINNENLKGQRTSDGMTWLYLPDADQYRDYWPVVDSRFLPGTTSAGEQGWCDEQYRVTQLGRANIAWAGGNTLNSWASASMHLKVPTYSLKAKKSWFMAPHELVMLGSQISSSNPAVTTIANQKISDSAQVLVDGTVLQPGQEKKATQSVVLRDKDNNIIWKPLADSTAQVSVKKRQGDWADIGTSSGKVSAQFLTIIQSHRTESDNHYAWVIWPSANELSSTHSGITLLVNDPKVQAVSLPDQQVVYANFWRSASVAGIKALTPMSLIMTTTVQGFQVAVSSPRRDSRVSFQLTENAVPLHIANDPDKRVSLNGNIISVDVSHLRGSSYSFELIRNKQD